jgi:hypothetical protein
MEKNMKYMLEIETAEDKIIFAEEVLRTLPFVKEVTPITSEKKTLADMFGKLKRGIDGLDYQKEMRNEWN